MIFQLYTAAFSLFLSKLAFADTTLLQDVLSYATSENQVFINIPTSLSPWKSIDVIQYNNILSIEWDSNEGSSFLECQNNLCMKASQIEDFGDETDAAAGYDINPKSNMTSIKYVSPKMVGSTDGNYNVSFVVVIQYDDDKQAQYAQIDTSFLT